MMRRDPFDNDVDDEQVKPDGLHCCLIDCKNLPEWEIRYSDRPDDYSQACFAHVGELLVDSTNTVYPIEAVYPVGEGRSE